MARIYFHGGALSVTGANYLLETEKSKIIVDCGMFQGSKHSEEQNYENFPYNPAEVDAVFITHSHIDHIGRLPKLVKDGYKGPIYSTPPTVDITPVMLDDSQGIIAQEADREGIEPLYSKDDVMETAGRFKGIDYNKEINPTQDIRVRFRDAGHILGSAIIEVWVKENDKETKIVFSGDLGNPPTPLLRPTEFIEEADYVLVETVYGNRIHEDRAERKELLENAIEDTVTSGGTLMVPAFALERTQEMLFEIQSLIENNRIPKIPIFLDSPLAINATKAYKKHTSSYNKKTMDFVKKGNKLFDFENLKLTYSTQDSKSINAVSPPKVIIAGSGMSTAGRILHHEKRYLPDPKSMLLIMGYQARNTLGRRILDGADEVKMFGEMVPVRCNIRAIGGYSAHADQDALYHWIEHMHNGGKLKKVFCIQGEEEAAQSFAVKLRDNMVVDAHVPKEGEVFEF